MGVEKGTQSKGGKCELGRAVRCPLDRLERMDAFRVPRGGP